MSRALQQLRAGKTGAANKGVQMGRGALPCVVCTTALQNTFDDADNQPAAGLACISHGHYGSTVWDPMDGQYIEFNVCDECIKRLASEGMILHGRDSRPVITSTRGSRTVVGYEKVKRALAPWDGKSNEEELVVDLEEVGAEEITFTHEGRQRIQWLPGVVKWAREELARLNKEEEGA